MLIRLLLGVLLAWTVALLVTLLFVLADLLLADPLLCCSETFLRMTVATRRPPLDTSIELEPLLEPPRAQDAVSDRQLPPLSLRNHHANPTENTPKHHANSLPPRNTAAITIPPPPALVACRVNTPPASPPLRPELLLPSPSLPLLASKLPTLKLPKP
ncbi:hypothetical protein FPQ18DRAFT_346781 [Pyronema domesticum]|nr:hypothetical protein FPQ18DRAFT_346781 [Pyronema domesticum]